MTKVAIKIQLKKEVLDVKGRAILKILQKENPLVKECRYGKYIELILDEPDHEKALKKARHIVKNILHNDLIETFELEVLDDPPKKKNV